MNVCIYARSPVVNDPNREKSVGSIPSYKKPNRNNQCTGRVSRQLWVKTTHIVNRIKSFTVPCGSRLMLIFFSSGRCFSCRLLGAGTACWPETVGFPTGCSYFDRLARLAWIVKREAVRLPSWLQFVDRLGRPGLRNEKLFSFPPCCSFLDREHELRKILIRHQIHSTKKNL